MTTDLRKGAGRILALEVRPTVTGFAVLDVFSLLDSGRCTHRAAAAVLPQTAGARISALLEQHRPSFVVARWRIVRATEARNRIGVIFRVVRREAKKANVAFQIVGSDVVDRFFASQGCESKEERAQVIARLFPELSWKLPRKRRPWNSEDHRMAIFDAAATALTFLNRAQPGNE